MSEYLKIDSIKKVLNNLLANREINDELPEDIAKDPELCSAFRTLFDIRRTFSAMSIGDLDFFINGKGYYVGLVKSFQAALRHLTWQTKTIASGDFTQRVDFLGEFSTSFNQMTNSLDDAMKQIKKSEQEYKQLFENAAEAIAVVQKDQVMIWNPMFAELTGYGEGALKSISASSLIHPQDREIAIKTLLSNPSANEKTILSFRTIKKDGSVRWIECKGVKIIWEEKKAILFFLKDITAQKQAQDLLAQSEEKYRLLAETSSDIVWIFNLDKRKILYVSPSIYYLLGFTPEEAMSTSIKEVVSPLTYSQTRQMMEETIRHFIQHPEEHRVTLIEVQQKNKNGEYVWVEMSVTLRYNAAREVEFVGASRIIEKRKKAEEKVVYLSYHDQLTGLYNRRFFDEEFSRIDTVENLPITVVMADVNGLKLTNDAFGHQSGDVLIKTFSNILKKHFRPSDVIVRIGGDEFVVLLKNTTGKQAKELIDMVNKSIGERSLKEIILSASFGLHTKEQAEESLEKTYRMAENKMYHAKLKESKVMKKNTILLIQKNLNEKSKRSRSHSENVGKLCREIGIAMKLDKAVVDELFLLGLYHDIGKIAINDNILNKKEPLTDIEIAKLRRHSEIGYQILRSASEYANLADYVLSHHERIDGTGYPRNLTEDEIPFPAKILAAAEAYDFMTNVKWEPFSPQEACARLLDGAGIKFDKNVVSVLVHEVLGF